LKDRGPIEARYALCEPGAGTASLLNLLGQLVFVEAVRQTISSRAPIQPGLMRALGDPELAPTLALVYQAPAREWTLKSLAHEAAMSRSSFARRFKESMGIPAMSWITDL
jgi:transcriptional regulator GlxA family with amidase domain